MVPDTFFFLSRPDPASLVGAVAEVGGGGRRGGHGARSSDPLCEGFGKQRWIPPNKVSFCRFHKILGGLDVRTEGPTSHLQAITCGGDDAGILSDEVRGGDASRVNGDMANTPDPL